MINEGSSIILNFMTPGAGVFVIGHAHILVISQKYSFSTPEHRAVACMMSKEIDDPQNFDPG